MSQTSICLLLEVLLKYSPLIELVKRAMDSFMSSSAFDLVRNDHGGICLIATLFSKYSSNTMLFACPVQS
jgi:hypothetical protein